MQYLLTYTQNNNKIRSVFTVYCFIHNIFVYTLNLYTVFITYRFLNQKKLSFESPIHIHGNIQREHFYQLKKKVKTNNAAVVPLANTHEKTKEKQYGRKQSPLGRRSSLSSGKLLQLTLNEFLKLMFFLRLEPLNNTQGGVKAIVVENKTFFFVNSKNVKTIDSN